MKRLFTFLFVLLSACMLLLGCKEKTKPEIIRPVKAIKLQVAAGLGGNKYPGRAEATTELNLGFEVQGTILERPVNKGDSVKKGQLLARLDPRDFQNEIRAAVAERDRNKAFRDRIAEALKSNAVSRQSLDDAEARLEQSRAAVRIKRKALEDAHINAPFDGSVSWTYKEAGQRVQAKENVLRLLDISKIEFTVDVPETLIANAYNVKDVTITFDAFPDRKISARVKEIGTEASAGTRTFPVTLIFDQLEDITILPGMAGIATGDPSGGEAKDAEPEFLLPLTAFFTADGQTHKVWVIEEATMTVKAHEVTRGKLTARGQYAKGLQEGMWVATAGANTLLEGQKVTIAEPIRRSERPIEQSQ
ncbi:MAG: efflux RND transporter periplasmic adaptor subunit [Desulfobacterales bacterium]|nr:efflux RND transporter periplasmic adaptor subunit [Desulfobacterales bacterium]MDJ0912383.1 efflux RND transporter periplasmic adaptor subunit [Desulfobacterales bacterium]